MKMKNGKTLISYFCGGGGVSLAGEQLGMYTIGVEIDPKIAEVYGNNLKGELIVGDVTKIDVDAIARMIPYGSDVIWQLSPPCQDYSVANRNKDSANTESARATVLDKISHHLHILKPKSVILENVRAYAKAPSFLQFVDLLESSGYQVTYSILNSADYGVPQTRQRLIMIASQSKTYVRPTHCEGTYLQQMELFEESRKKWVGWYDAVRDILDIFEDCELSQKQIARLRKEELNPGENTLMQSQFLDRTGSTIRGCLQPAFTITGICNTKVLMPITGFYDLPVYRTGDRPSPTVRCSVRNFSAVLEGCKVKKLDYRAMARFQAFPDTYNWSSSKGLNSKIVGNAVPVLFAKRILQSVL